LDLKGCRRKKGGAVEACAGAGSRSASAAPEPPAPTDKFHGIIKLTLGLRKGKKATLSDFFLPNSRGARQLPVGEKIKIRSNLFGGQRTSLKPKERRQ
jgi:hypothetical protein